MSGTDTGGGSLIRKLIVFKRTIWMLLLLVFSLLLAACGDDTGEAIERGERWATLVNCIACHSTDGTEMVGPTWQGISGRVELLEDGTTITVDDAYLIKSILDPAAQIVDGFENSMPKTFEAQFAARERGLLADEGLEVDMLSDLVAYISSIP